MKHKNKKWIGIDVGGTKILLQVFDAKGKALITVRQATIATKGKQAFLNQLYTLIDAQMDNDIKGIGIGLPGIVDIHKGILVQAPHLPTGKNLPLRALLLARYKIPVHIDNDINAFLTAEASQTRLAKYRDVIAIMIGTGVGGAALVNGQLLYGKNGFAGEIGHIITQAGHTKDTLEKQLGGAYQKGKIDYKKAAHALAVGLSNLNLIFNPAAIVLGGSVYTHHLSRYKKSITAFIRSRSLDGTSPQLMDAKKSTSVPRGAVMLLQKTQR